MNMEDRKNSFIRIEFHSYKPKSSKGIFPIESYPKKFLQDFSKPKEGVMYYMIRSGVVVYQAFR